MCFSWVISRVYNPRKMCVFSFIGLMWQILKTLMSSLPLPHSNLSQTKIDFHLKPINFKFESLQNLFKGMFLNNLFTLFLDYVEIFLGLSWIGDFWKRVWLILGKIFSKSWLGFAPFDLFVSVLAPCGNLILYLVIFSYVHALPICVV